MSLASPASGPNKTNYRADIDGLRAIAVLSILAFHVDSSVLPGGYIGVDIFFVISGFLITSIIRGEMESGTFTFRQFYLRRPRRIAPAYFATIAATLAVGSLLLLPSDLLLLARSALWSLLGVPNFYFWQHIDTGYFAPSSDQIPLLHLWSLGVEEQYYVLWPITAYILFKLSSSRLWTASALAVIIVASFAWAEHALAADPAFAFYMLPTRAGELAIGAILPCFTNSRATTMRRHTSEILAFVGLGIIAGALLLLEPTSRFPGYNALFPCIGTALLIHAGTSGRNAVTAPLRWAPVVQVGRMSYSLYLWHWPVLAFLRYFYTDLDAKRSIAALAATFALATFSYLFVETPFRHPATSSRWRVATAYATPWLMLAIGAFGLIQTRGLETVMLSNVSYQSRLAALDAYTAPAHKFQYNCQQTTFKPDVLRRNDCVLGDLSSGPPRVLLWGDSHAAHYIGVIDAIAKSRHFAFRNASYSKCGPVFGPSVGPETQKFHAGCNQFRQLVRASLDDYDVIILGAAWSISFQTPSSRNELRQTIAELLKQGKQIILLGQVPIFSGYDRSCEVKRLRDSYLDCFGKATTPDVRPAEWNIWLRSLTTNDGRITYFDVGDALCASGTCSPYVSKRPVYFDQFHLSMSGSHLLGDRIVARSMPLPAIFDTLSSKHLATRNQKPASWH
jgi:peptidoglycan/LPS O-acetylase OafA/YrhL